MSEKKSISHTSQSDLTHSMAHYLLTIHKLREEKGYARVTDIAKELGVTKGSVSTALNNLKKRQLVLEDESKFLSLSQVGHSEVHQILSIRTLMYYFLKDVIGLNKDIAHNDSCLVEHLLSKQTQEGLFKFMKQVGKDPIKIKLNTKLDLTQYKDHEEFSQAQKGDQYL